MVNRWNAITSSLFPWLVLRTRLVENPVAPGVWEETVCMPSQGAKVAGGRRHKYRTPPPGGVFFRPEATMIPVQLGADIVAQTMTHLLPAKFDGAPARVLLLAIGMEETGFATRRQMGGGPGRSYWQFEQGGGIRGVLTHPASKVWARSVCGLRAVAPVESDVYAAFLVDDQLACAFARLLLFTDPAALPVVGDEQGAWDYYLRTWRPGDYARGTPTHQQEIRQRWAGNYIAAQAAVIP